MREANKYNSRLIERVRQLIAEDKIIKALEELETIIVEKEDANFIVQQRARLAEINKQFHINIISSEYLNTEKAKIRLAILSFLNEIEKENIGIVSPKSQHNITRTNLFRVLLIGSLVSLVLYIVIPSIDPQLQICAAPRGNPFDTIENSSTSPLPYPSQAEPTSSRNPEEATTSPTSGTIKEDTTGTNPVKEEMIQITVKLYSESDSTINLEGYTVYFKESALSNEKATTNMDGVATLSFPKSISTVYSAIVAVYKGNEFTSGRTHRIPNERERIKIPIK